MLPLTAVRIQITTADTGTAPRTYTSYTLPSTPFYIKPILFDDSYNRFNILWNFGDGTTFTGPSAIHSYRYPGTYSITAVVYDDLGNAQVASITPDLTVASVTVQNALPDLVIFNNLQPAGTLGVYTLPAGKKSDPLEIWRYNSWQNDDLLRDNNYTVMLYASGSHSDFMSVSSYYTNKWSHLRSYFGFIETYVTPEGINSSRLIDSTRTTSTSVFAEWSDDYSKLEFYNFKKVGTAFAGTTGTSIDYNVSYVDQRPSSNDDTLIFLYANFNTKGFLELDSSIEDRQFNTINYPYGYINYPTQVSYLKSIFNPVESLAITSNGISTEGTEQNVGPLSSQLIHSFSIYPVKWCNTDIPFVVTFKDKDQFTTKCYPPITGFKFDGSDPTDLNTVSLGLYRIVEQDPTATFTTLSTYRLDDAVFTQNSNAPRYQRSGAYFCGVLNKAFPASTIAISAAVLIQDSPVINTAAGYGFAGQPGFKNIKRFTKEPIFTHANYEDLHFDLTGNYQTYFTASSSTMPVSISPLKSYSMGNIDKVWVADSDEDIVYVYTLSGTILNTFKLSAVPTFIDNFTAPEPRSYLGDLNSASPSNIAIDSKGNAWVTLYDAISTIRISTSTDVVDAVAVPSYENTVLIDPTLYISSKDTLSGLVGENLILPSCIDTDTADNVWVGYSHPVRSFLVKYSSLGKQLSVIGLDAPLSIQEIIVDKNNHLIAFAKNLNENDPYAFANYDILYKWDSNLNLVSGYPLQFNSIGNITIDLYQNIWVHHEFSKLSCITHATNDVKEFFIGSSNFDSRYYQGIDGIAADNEGYVWILHNYEGKIYFFPQNTTTQLPLSSLYKLNLPDIQLTAPDGMQAFYKVFGDWTGVRWVNKYASVINPLPRIVRGTSNLFNIIQNTPIINKINENFDQAASYKSYILQESLFDKNILLDDFIGQIVGDYNSPPEVLGKTIYERIANFNANTTDPETCTIESLKSLAQQYGLQYYDFTSGYPSKLRRSVDLLSINHSKLFGSTNQYSQNFGLSTFRYDLGSNLGGEISIDTGTFVVGQPVVAFEKFSEKYKLISNTIIPETNGVPVVLGEQYPLSGVNYYWGWGLVTGNRAQSGIDIKPYYMFYQYNPYTTNNVVDNVIDFNNPLTTILPTDNNYQEWNKYGGIMETVLARALYEGLELYKVPVVVEGQAPPVPIPTNKELQYLSQLLNYNTQDLTYGA